MNAKGTNGCATSPSLPGRTGLGVYPFWHCKVWRAVYRLTPESPLGHYFDALTLTLLLHVIGVSQLTVALLVAHSKDGLAWSDSLFADYLQHLRSDLCDRFEGTRIATLMR